MPHPLLFQAFHIQQRAATQPWGDTGSLEEHFRGRFLERWLHCCFFLCYHAGCFSMAGSYTALTWESQPARTAEPTHQIVRPQEPNILQSLLAQHIEDQIHIRFRAHSLLRRTAKENISHSHSFSNSWVHSRTSLERQTILTTDRH